MASVMMMDRAMGAASGTMGIPMTAMPAAMPNAMPGMILPRCKMKFDKCAGGMKVTCNCDDDVACATLQNLCRMMSDGLCSWCCTLNGMCVCQCNMTMAMCKCEYTAKGVCITCTSGDKTCCEMIQACCECLKACTAAGCSCCLCFNNTPVCCGCC